jgi:hypothetical protein
MSAEAATPLVFDVHLFPVVRLKVLRRRGRLARGSDRAGAGAGGARSWSGAVPGPASSTPKKSRTTSSTSSAMRTSRDRSGFTQPRSRS